MIKRLNWRERFHVLLCLLTLVYLWPRPVYAVYNPAVAAPMNRLVAQSVYKRMVARGFAANDPRIAATTSTMGTVATAASTAASAVAAIAGAPVWVTIAIGLGVTALAVGAYYLFAPDSPDAVTQNPALPIPVAKADGSQWRAPKIDPVTSPTFPTSSPDVNEWFDVLLANNMAEAACVGWWTDTIDDGSGLGTCFNTLQEGVTVAAAYWNLSTGAGVVQADTICASGYSLTTGRFFADCSLMEGGAIGRQIRFSKAADTVTPSEWAQRADAALLNEKANLQAVADISNKLWEQAALQPGYQGVPYDAAQKVTALDVAQSIATDPTLGVTVRDLVSSPVRDGAGNIVIPTPNGYTGPNPVPLPDPNAGTDPPPVVVNVETCGLPGKPPCAIDWGGQAPPPGDPVARSDQELRGAVTNPWLSFAGWSVPTHLAQCPTASFEALSRTFVLDAHCALLDAHTSALRAAMIAVFGIASLFVVMRA